MTGEQDSNFQKKLKDSLGKELRVLDNPVVDDILGILQSDPYRDLNLESHELPELFGEGCNLEIVNAAQYEYFTWKYQLQDHSSKEEVEEILKVELKEEMKSFEYMDALIDNIGQCIESDNITILGNSLVEKLKKPPYKVSKLQKDPMFDILEVKLEKLALKGEEYEKLVNKIANKLGIEIDIQEEKTARMVKEKQENDLKQLREEPKQAKDGKEKSIEEKEKQLHIAKSKVEKFENLQELRENISLVLKERRAKTVFGTKSVFIKDEQVDKEKYDAIIDNMNKLCPDEEKWSNLRKDSPTTQDVNKLLKETKVELKVSKEFEFKKNDRSIIKKILSAIDRVIHWTQGRSTIYNKKKAASFVKSVTVSRESEKRSQSR